MTNARNQFVGITLSDQERGRLERIAALSGKTPAEQAAEMVTSAIKAFEDTGTLNPPVNPLIYQTPSETVHEVGAVLGVLMTVNPELLHGDDNQCAWLKLMCCCQDALLHAERHMETADVASKLRHDRIMGKG